jgi:hypothetical protein
LNAALPVSSTTRASMKPPNEGNATYSREEQALAMLRVPSARFRLTWSDSHPNSGPATRKARLEALDRLAALTADLPPIDAVRIAEERRHELEERPSR